MFLGLFLVILGTIWLLQNLGILPGSLQIFWPLVIIALGLSILFNKKSPQGWCQGWFPGKDGKK